MAEIWREGEKLVTDCALSTKGRK